MGGEIPQFENEIKETFEAKEALAANSDEGKESLNKEYKECQNNLKALYESNVIEKEVAMLRSIDKVVEKTPGLTSEQVMEWILGTEINSTEDEVGAKREYMRDRARDVKMNLEDQYGDKMPKKIQSAIDKYYDFAEGKEEDTNNGPQQGFSFVNNSEQARTHYQMFLYKVEGKVKEVKSEKEKKENNPEIPEEGLFSGTENYKEGGEEFSGAAEDMPETNFYEELVTQGIDVQGVTGIKVKEETDSGTLIKVKLKGKKNKFFEKGKEEGAQWVETDRDGGDIEVKTQKTHKISERKQNRIDRQEENQNEGDKTTKLNEGKDFVESDSQGKELTDPRQYNGLLNGFAASNENFENVPKDGLKISIGRDGDFLVVKKITANEISIGDNVYRNEEGTTSWKSLSKLIDKKYEVYGKKQENIKNIETARLEKIGSENSNYGKFENAFPELKKAKDIFNKGVPLENTNPGEAEKNYDEAIGILEEFIEKQDVLVTKEVSEDKVNLLKAFEDGVVNNVKELSDSHNGKDESRLLSKFYTERSMAGDALIAAKNSMFTPNAKEQEKGFDRFIQKAKKRYEKAYATLNKLKEQHPEQFKNTEATKEQKTYIPSSKEITDLMNRLSPGKTNVRVKMENDKGFYTIERTSNDEVKVNGQIYITGRLNGNGREWEKQK